MYSCAAGNLSTLLVVKTSTNAVVGAYASSEWAPQEGYFGDDECFVFNFSGAGDGSTLSTFRGNSGANSFFQLANEDSLAMGGGGNCALMLDCEGFGGTTGACDTFQSPPLVPGAPASAYGQAMAAQTSTTVSKKVLQRISEETDFQCSNIEIWGFVPATSNPLARSQDAEVVASLVVQKPDFGVV
jgi:hypothetical protein